MAKFNIPGNYDRVTAQYFNDAWKYLSTAIDYTQGSNEVFIYSNFPEYLEDTHLGDADYPCYINRVAVDNKENVLIYLTHHLEKLSGSYTLGIRVYNPASSGSITFTKKHEGYSNTNSWSNPGLAWEAFFADQSGTTTVSAGESKWLAQKSISLTGNAGGSFFDYFGEFTVTGSFVIAVYVCKNINKVPDLTYSISWNNNATYSGYSDCYSLTGSKTLDMADALVSFRNSFYFGISNPEEGLGSANEKVPIHLTQGGTATTADNVGNYGLQYKLTFNFKNTSSTPVQVKAYLISNPVSHFAGISSANGCSKFLNTENESSNNRWNFYTSPTITSSSGTTTIDFTYCHLGLGSRGAILQFEAVPV